MAKMVNLVLCIFYHNQTYKKILEKPNICGKIQQHLNPLQFAKHFHTHNDISYNIQWWKHLLVLCHKRKLRFRLDPVWRIQSLNHLCPKSQSWTHHLPFFYPLILTTIIQLLNQRHLKSSNCRLIRQKSTVAKILQTVVIKSICQLQLPTLVPATTSGLLLGSRTCPANIGISSSCPASGCKYPFGQILHTHIPSPRTQSSGWNRCP